LFTESEYHVRTKIIEADFTNDSHDAYHAIEKELYGMEIGVLINNVGMSYPHPEYFLELPDRDKIYSHIIKCNISSVTNMTLMILPQMVERKKGVVVNVSSTTAIIPSPLLTVYGASKVSSSVCSII
jgi:17beta-estradiol 17-dehydrogenase / very-long-chain 3-oxoacyl-CoA reductase